MYRILVHDELVRSALSHVFLADAEIQLDVGTYDSARPIETAHFGEVTGKIAVIMLEDDDALAVIKRQQEVVVGSDVNRLELGAGHVKCVEWRLDGYECQLANRRIGLAWKRDE